MRILFLSVLAILLHQPGFSQALLASEDLPPDDELIRGKLMSTYREFFKWKDYDLALDSWWTLFNDYPDVSEKLYVDGVTMYRHFIKGTPEGQARNAKIDTLMLIYDQRMTYFGGEGNVLGRKGSDLLRFRSDSPDKVQAAYGMLKKSLDIQETQSREAVLLNYMAAGLLLHKASVIDRSQVMEDYFQVTGLLDQHRGSSSRRERTRATIEGMIQKEDILSCEGLDLHFEPQFEQNSKNPELLEKIIHSYSLAGCEQSALYTAASEKLYDLDPGSESAHELALLFISRNDLEKAARYLQMAVADDQLPKDKRAEWFYELCIVCLAKGNPCDAIAFAREALAYRDNHAKAYLALGDAFIACRTELGDDFCQQSAYWAAADMYQTASKIDPALAEESSEKLDLCAAQFPSKEEIFFQDLSVGTNYRVGGCIQENTTVRSRD